MLICVKMNTYWVSKINFCGEGQMKELSGAPIQLILKPNLNVEEVCSVAGGRRN